MAPSVKPTIRTQVYQLLRREICGGVYAAGQWLHEEELCKRFQVSRSPAREALRLLAGDGLVVEVPNKGVYVKELSARDVEDICDVRTMMETFAILHTDPRLVKEREEELTALIRSMSDTCSAERLEDYIALDAKLHDLYVALSGNRYLMESYEKVHMVIQQFRIFSLMDPQRRDESCDEHRQTVSAILGGDTDWAAAVNRKHLALAKEKIIAHLQAQPRYD